MKRIYTLLLLLAPVLLATSCQEDDAVLQTEAVQLPAQNEEPEEPQTQEGSWSLVNVTGSIAGVSYDYPVGQITWTFNEDSTIDVVNNNTDMNVEDFLDSGNYVFGYIPSEITTTCSEDLFVWCFVLGCQNIDGNTMTITQQFADGYTLTFRKN